MVTEDYVTVEIARLLKDKGFDEYCRAEWLEYINSPSKGKTYLTECGRGLQHDSCSNSSLEKFNYDGQMYYAAPTHQMAMRWLREEKNIHINIYWLSIIKQYHTEIIEGEKGCDDNFNTYEDAVEYALKYCLTKLL